MFDSKNNKVIQNDYAYPDAEVSSIVVRVSGSALGELKLKDNKDTVLLQTQNLD